MLIGALYLLIELTGTSVLFTSERLVVRQSWLRHFTGRYTDVSRVALTIRAIQVDFVDGRRLKFHPDLGPWDKVISYLEARLPEHIPVTIDKRIADS